jgi:hypothetical protein
MNALKKQHSVFRIAPMLFLAVLMPAIAIATTTPAYTAGVTGGEWASYSPVNVTYYGTKAYSTEPQYVKDLKATAKITDIVQSVYQSTNVTIRSVAQYENSTTRTETLNGDLATGLGNLTFRLIAGGLSARNPVWPVPYTPSINRTVSMTYLGISRAVNILNITQTPPSLIINLEYIWDQDTGILLESKNMTILPRLAQDGGYVLYTRFKIQSTNVFSNPVSPEYTVTSSTPASVTGGTSATTTITITSVNGFTGQITLTTSVPPGLTCDPINPSTITGSGTAQLSCRSNTPGTYTVTITTTNGATTHTTTTTITVTAAPSGTPNVPSLRLTPTILYAIAGAVILIVAAAGAYLFLRRRPLTHPESTRIK